MLARRPRSSSVPAALALAALATFAVTPALATPADPVPVLDALLRPLAPSTPPAGLVVESRDAGALAARLASTPLPTPDALATSATWSWEPNVANATFGRSPVTAGDVNGDGFSDLVALGGSGSSAELYLFLGSSSGFALAPGYPFAITSRTGGTVDAAGDLNGDGFADIALGFPTATAGYVRVYYGTATGLDTAHPFEQFVNFVTNYGDGVAPGGDLNGDGYDDLVVSASNSEPWASCGGSGVAYGRVDVLYGSATGVHQSDWMAFGCTWAGKAHFGSTATGAGDVNGDGYGDLLIGAPGYAVDGITPQGAIWVVYGSASGLPLVNGYTNVGSLVGATRIESGEDGSGFGVAGCAAGDLNGDGFADVAVGAPGSSIYGVNSGHAIVYAGGAGGLTTTKVWEDYGPVDDDRLGATLACAGDVNGDGRGDLMIGFGGGVLFARSSGSSLFLGTFYPTTVPQYVASAGDVNGDGLGDVVIGDAGWTNGQTAEGRIQVFAGRGDGPSASTSWSMTTVYENPNLGWSAASAGDVNGDGLDDVLVGAPTWDVLATPSDYDDGAVFLYLGNRNGLAASPSWYAFGSTGDQLGVAACGLGDVNGDGYADFALGAHQPGTGYGKVLVFFGHAGGPSSTPDRVLGGPSFDSQFGTALTGGDFNGDGYADLVVGSPNNDGGGYTNCGGAFMYLGGATGVAAANVWAAQGSQNDEHFGATLAGTCDTNGDGYSDLVVGSPGRDVGSPFALVDCGRVTEFGGDRNGSVLTLRRTIDGGANESFGYGLANAGDVNGDGYSDVIVGAPNANTTLSGQGRAVVLAGSQTGLGTSPYWSQLGGEAFGSFGSAVSSAGDVDGDGLSDVLVGAVFQDDGGAHDRGVARVYAGPLAAGSAPVWTGHGASATANMGHALANAGDVNGDGWSDLLFGEPGYDVGTYRQGRAELFLGGDGYSRLRLTLARRAVSGPNIVPMGFSTAGVAPGILDYSPSPAGRTKFRTEWDVRSVVGLPSAPIGSLYAPWSSTGNSAYGALAAAWCPISGMQIGVPYSYRVRARFHHPYFPTSRWITASQRGVREVALRSPGTWVGVEGEAPAPAAATLALSEPSPNPARGATSLAFTLPHAGRVTLAVVDVQGRRVRTLLDTTRPAGTHRVTWDGLDEGGRAAAAGLYFVRLDAAGELASRKLARIR